MDVKWNYVAATYLSYESPSNDMTAELIYRALDGMESVCAELGLPYTAEDFPPYRPGKKHWVDHQELTSPKLNAALLKHLDWEVAFAGVGKGDDKGMVEGGIGHDKRTLKRRTAGFFGKRALSGAIERARHGTDLDLLMLDKELIRITYEWNHMSLPADKVPREFLATGRPATRVELFKWDLERNRELIKASPPRSDLPFLLLPTQFYKVHAGRGIYIPPGMYYSSSALVEAGLLRKRAKGDAPQVEVARHRGTTRFVFWVRGPRDVVRCMLHARQEDALGSMSVADAEEHMRSMPSVKKREQLRTVQRSAASGSPKTARAHRSASVAARKGHLTRDKARTNAAKKVEVARKARSDAHQRFPELDQVADASQKARGTTPTFDADHANETEQLVAKHLQQLGETHDPPN